MTTIKEIAAKASVSTATVSRILSSDQTLSVSDETRKRVLDTAAQLNYKPARRKNGKSTASSENKAYSIGVLLSLSQEDEVNDPYFRQIRAGIEMMCDQLGLTISVLIRTGNGSFSPQLNMLDGLIVVGSVNTGEVINSFYKNKNIVLIDDVPVPTAGYDMVSADLSEGMNAIIDHLISQGRSSIAYIGGTKTITDMAENEQIEVDDIRKTAFLKRMKQEGLLNLDYILTGDWTPNSGYQLMKKLLDGKERPDAVITGSDPIAIGVLRTLNEAQIQVPKEIAVVSFDDIESAAFLNPPLSSVKLYPDELGKTAVKLLVDRLQNNRTVPMKAILGTNLIIRESSRPVT